MKADLHPGALRDIEQAGAFYEREGSAALAFARRGAPVGLSFQNRGGFVPPYRARQSIEMIRKYAGAQE